MTQPWPLPADAHAARVFAERFAAAAPGHAVPAELLAAIGGNSPYLAELSLREPALLQAAAQRGPDAVCDAALAELGRLPPGLSRAELADALRQAKRHVALAAALGDISGVWRLEQVTSALSDLADGALRAGVRHLLRGLHQRGDLRLPHAPAPDRGCGFTVLALGKLGARELNFSSDIDLILLYDPEIYPEASDRLGGLFVRMARDLVALMEAREAGGYVFRTDLRLRPDPASTPLAIALPGALAYYESQGQTWERAALIKARAVAGDLTLGRRFLDAIRPFIWRRHLDFAALADIRAMKQRIDAQKGTALGQSGALASRVLGHNLKLGQGGIREIEFCAQALQLVWGGRMPSLRGVATIDVLAAASQAQLLPQADMVLLEGALRFLRTAEHRLQMVADRQTHSLPETPERLEAFAVFMGFASAEDFAAEALTHLLAVRRIFAGLFEGLPSPAKAEPALPPEMAAWVQGKPRALRSERSRALLRGLLPAIQAALARQQDPQAALMRMDEFIHRLPAGVQMFSMLTHNPALLERLADVFGAVPWLADHLVRVPSALEGLAHPGLEDAEPAAALAARLEGVEDTEEALEAASGFVRGQEFAIAVAEFFGRLSVAQAGLARAQLADAAISALLRLTLAQHVARYGRIEGGAVAVVALGKAGSGEMLAGSDLDLMLVYDHAQHAAESDGARGLAPSQYFARLAQSFIAALTVQTPHGPLYSVDMRLRPSGSKGPMAVSLASLRAYHRASAWTWESLALTRARVVAGPARLERRVAAALRAALRRAAQKPVLADTAAMRARLARELPGGGIWDVKLRPGGLMECELLVQALQLQHARLPGVLRPGTLDAIAGLAAAGCLSPADAETLRMADLTWRRVQGVLRIALGSRKPTHLPPPCLEKLLPLAPGATDEAGLARHLDAVAASVRNCFERLIGEITPP